MNKHTIQELKEKAKVIRLGILETMQMGKKSHLGGSMSSADLVTALYFYKMRHNPKNPNDPDRDRFIFSKGHSVLAQYSALAECGYFPKDELKKTKTLGSLLQGHPEIKTPGIEANTGSLGQGLSIGLGMAIGGKLDEKDYKVYVILGDGETAEGQIWEAVNTASFYKLDNLVAIVDYNKLQAVGFLKKRYDIGDIRGKFSIFGWKTFEIDGHNMEDIVATLDEIDRIKGLPTAIIAHTVKGKGVSFAENNPGFHNAPLNQDQLEQAKKDIIEQKTSEVMN
jgi:transketolase